MFPYTRRYKSGSTFAELSANNKGYSITYSRNGKVISTSTFYVHDGYNRSVGRIAANRELKSGNFRLLK